MAESDQTNFDRTKEISDALAVLEEKKRADKHKTMNDIITIAGAESKLGKAMLIAKQAMALKEMIMEMKATLFSAKQTVVKATLKGTEAAADSASGVAKTSASAPFPYNIPMIIGYVAQAVGIIGAVKSAVKQSKKAAATVGGVPSIGGEIQMPTAAAAAAATPPDLTSVGGSGFNQIADAIGQQNQTPIQTYVVASDVTTAQSLDRNIIDGATL